jgi:hypothetical protein
MEVPPDVVRTGKGIDPSQLTTVVEGATTLSDEFGGYVRFFDAVLGTVVDWTGEGHCTYSADSMHEN